MQGCMEQTFKKADQLLGFNSRYKPEISYDMTQTQTPPLPFMHREDGQDTTEPSHYWQGRVQQEIDNYAAGRGMVRRPDLVIVNDPCQPPNQSNIERVVEIKFQGDNRDVLAAVKNRLNLAENPIMGSHRRKRACAMQALCHG